MGPRCQRGLSPCPIARYGYIRILAVGICRWRTRKALGKTCPRAAVELSKDVARGTRLLVRQRQSAGVPPHPRGPPARVGFLVRQMRDSASAGGEATCGFRATARAALCARAGVVCVAARVQPPHSQPLSPKGERGEDRSSECCARLGDWATGRTGEPGARAPGGRAA
jgi:hypothetical protein